MVVLQRFRAEFDKEGNVRIVPLTPRAQAAILRIVKTRPGIGDAPMFPRADDASKPIDRYLAGSWLGKAERLADLPPLKQGLWHPYRRKWVSDRPDVPLPVLAAAGGWKSTRTVELCYHVTAPSQVLAVMLNEAEAETAEAQA